MKFVEIGAGYKSKGPSYKCCTGQTYRTTINKWCLLEIIWPKEGIIHKKRSEKNLRWWCQNNFDISCHYSAVTVKYLTKLLILSSRISYFIK